jgi:hypothetical protein
MLDQSAAQSPTSSSGINRIGGYRGTYAMWAEATEAIQKFGTMVKSPTGFPIEGLALCLFSRSFCKRRLNQLALETFCSI